MEVEEDARMLNPKEVVKEFELEVEFDLASAKASQTSAYSKPA